MKSVINSEDHGDAEQAYANPEQDPFDLDESSNQPCQKGDPSWIKLQQDIKDQIFTQIPHGRQQVDPDTRSDPLRSALKSIISK